MSRNNPDIARYRVTTTFQKLDIGTQRHWRVTKTTGHNNCIEGLVLTVCSGLWEGLGLDLVKVGP